MLGSRNPSLTVCCQEIRDGKSEHPSVAKVPCDRQHGRPCAKISNKAAPKFSVIELQLLRSVNSICIGESRSNRRITNKKSFLQTYHAKRNCKYDVARRGVRTVSQRDSCWGFSLYVPSKHRFSIAQTHHCTYFCI